MLPALASAYEGLECDFPGQSRSYYHGEKVVLIFEGADTVWVFDAAALHFNDGDPVEGEVAVNNNAVGTYKWYLRWRFSNNETGTMGYRLSYQKSSGKATLSAEATANDTTNHSGAEGTCVAKDFKP